MLSWETLIGLARSSGRQRERGLQHLARGPAGIPNVRASFLGGHVCLLLYRMPELRDTTVYVERVRSARIRARGFSQLRGGGRSFLPSRGPLSTIVWAHGFEYASHHSDPPREGRTT